VKISTAVVSAVAALGLVVAGAPISQADVSLTSKQLTAVGFPKKPNVVDWAPGTVRMSTNTAAQWEDVVITGKAPDFTAPGQLLTLSRYVPTDTQGNGEMKPLNITTTVNPNGTFTMRMQLGYVGTYGYSVGYDTDSFSPEFVGFQFQLTTTGDSSAAAKGSSQAVQLTRKQLTRAGFTRKPNVAGWGGTATISTNRAPAGAPVTISGTAPEGMAPGSVMKLTRFVATDKKGSGHFEDLPIQTVVKADGTFELTFELNQKGTYGYGLGVSEEFDWLGIEFQLTTT